jgi:hypothetical protein
MKAFDGDGRLSVGALVNAGGARYRKRPLQSVSCTVEGRVFLYIGGGIIGREPPHEACILDGKEVVKRKF